MLLEAVYHRPKGSWAYAYDGRTVHVRLRTKKGDVKKAWTLAGDKYGWGETKQEIPMSVLFSDDYFDYWQAAVKPPYKRLKYSFKLQSGKQKVWFSEFGFSDTEPTVQMTMFEFPFIHEADLLKPPAWVKDAVFYQIFPERFANGDTSNDPEGVEAWGGKPTPKNFFGGDLQGVINHLDHLTDLGVNAIYFTPVFKATTNHKYDTADYKKVDPHFGTNETLKKLVEACHAKGIRVLLDAVFNHCGKTFAPFVDVLEKGKDSQYADWFYVREYPLGVVDGKPTYETFAFEPIMPKLNTAHPDVRAYLLDVAKYWIEEIGIDGWRLDVANEVDHKFWRDFHDAVKTANPDAYILGEIWHDSMPWLEGDQFDAVMNYPFTNAVLDFAAKRKTDAAGFAAAVGKQLAGYPAQANEAAFNLLDSHDTERLLTLCGGDKSRMRLAAVMQFTFPGTPCVYYGDEVGMEGGADPDCRRCMVWDKTEQDTDLFSFYQKLIRVRLGHSALRTGSLSFLKAESGKYGLVFQRKDEQGTFAIYINNGRKERDVTARLSEGEWTDVMTGASYKAKGEKLSLSLPPYGFAILRLTPAK